jgi:triosephosphate isomerase
LALITLQHDSPAQLANAEIPYVILGHSERRVLFHETSSLVADKTKAALAAKLTVILCCGETLEERESGNTDSVVQEQLKAVVESITESDWRFGLFPRCFFFSV